MKRMEIILHPTIQTEHAASYNHVIQINEVNIYIGNKESRESKKFDYIIEISDEDQVYDELSYAPKNVLRLKFNDVRTSNILDEVEKINEFIDNCRGKLLIHCGEGVSRSPSVLIMHLISKYNHSYEEAYNIVSSKRYIKPNIGFVRQLKSI